MYWPKSERYVLHHPNKPCCQSCARQSLAPSLNCESPLYLQVLASGHSVILHRLQIRTPLAILRQIPNVQVTSRCKDLVSPMSCHRDIPRRVDMAWLICHLDKPFHVVYCLHTDTLPEHALDKLCLQWRAPLFIWVIFIFESS